MDVMDLLFPLIKKSIGTIIGDKKVDLQLLKCYWNVYNEAGKFTGDELEDKEYFIAQTQRGLQYFDNSGNAVRMYCSLCYFFDEILSKNEYYYYVDRILRKMITCPELMAYVNLEEFKRNILEDIDVTKIKLEKTVGMILKDKRSLQRMLEKNYDYSGLVVKYDQPAKKIGFNAKENDIDLNKRVFVYYYDAKYKWSLCKEEQLDIDLKKQTVTFTLPVRATYLVTNTPITKKKVVLTSAQLKEDIEKLTAEKNKLHKKVKSLYTCKYFTYTAISKGRYKLTHKSLESLGSPKEVTLKAFRLGTLEPCDELLVFHPNNSKGEMVYEVLEDCNVAVLAMNK